MSPGIIFDLPMHPGEFYTIFNTKIKNYASKSFLPENFNFITSCRPTCWLYSFIELFIGEGLPIPSTAPLRTPLDRPLTDLGLSLATC